MFGSADSRICYPLMALIDFLGVRLIAMSVLPISSKTLVYGTADCGVTVHKDNEELSSLIEKAASRLHLIPHLCGLYEMGAKVLSTAADVEGHVGTDGRFYMIDFARMFPPTTPDPRIHRGYLYQVRRVIMNRYLRFIRSSFPNQVMRPELLPVTQRLCADTYSGFVRHDPKVMLFEAQVDTVTTLMKTKFIAKVILSCEIVLVFCDNVRLGRKRSRILVSTQQKKISTSSASDAAPTRSKSKIFRSSDGSHERRTCKICGVGGSGGACD